jgi:hypothetical protein
MERCTLQSTKNFKRHSLLHIWWVWWEVDGNNVMMMTMFKRPKVWSKPLPQSDKSRREWFLCVGGIMAPVWLGGNTKERYKGWTGHAHKHSLLMLQCKERLKIKAHLNWVYFQCFVMRSIIMCALHQLLGLSNQKWWESMGQIINAQNFGQKNLKEGDHLGGLE